MDAKGNKRILVSGEYFTPVAHMEQRYQIWPFRQFFGTFYTIFGHFCHKNKEALLRTCVCQLWFIFQATFLVEFPDILEVTGVENLAFFRHFWPLVKLQVKSVGFTCVPSFKKYAHALQAKANVRRARARAY